MEGLWEREMSLWDYSLKVVVVFFVLFVFLEWLCVDGSVGIAICCVVIRDMCC